MKFSRNYCCSIDIYTCVVLIYRYLLYKDISVFMVFIFSVTCPPGYYTKDRRTCASCPAGTYLNRGNLDSCFSCPNGNQSRKTGLTRQQDCYCKTYSLWSLTTCIIIVRVKQINIRKLQQYCYNCNLLFDSLSLIK